MKISTKGRYGLKAMFELACRYGETPVSIRAIAEAQGISEHYLEQLFKKLRKAGVVQSIRGAQGGYALARPPEEITIGALMILVPGVLFTNAMRDIIAGDMVAGISKTAEALLIGMAIALGTGVSLGLARLIWGGAV